MNYFTPGKIITTFPTKQKKEVILRTITWDDIDALTVYLNAISKEDTYVYFANRTLSRELIITHISNIFRDCELGNKVYIVAECEGKVIGNCHVDIEVTKESRAVHVGKVGISIFKDYRGEGVGEKLLRSVIAEIPQVLPFVKILMLEVFEENVIAQNLYKKLGFVETGRIPKGILYKGKYMDEIIMCLFLSKNE